MPADRRPVTEVRPALPCPNAPPTPRSPPTSRPPNSPPSSRSSLPRRSGISASAATTADAWPSTTRRMNSPTRSVLPVYHPLGRGVARRPGRPRSRLPAGPVGPRRRPAAAVHRQRHRGDRQPQRDRAGHHPRAGLRHLRRRGRSHGHRNTRVRRRRSRPGRTGNARRPAARPGPRPPHDHAQLPSSILSTGGAVVSLYRPGTEASSATLRASAILLAALVRAMILIEALDTAVVAADLIRPLLAPPAAEDIRADGSARLLAEQRAVLCPDPARALALLRRPQPSSRTRPFTVRHGPQVEDRPAAEHVDFFEAVVTTCPGHTPLPANRRPNAKLTIKTGRNTTSRPPTTGTVAAEGSIRSTYFPPRGFRGRQDDAADRRLAGRSRWSRSGVLARVSNSWRAFHGYREISRSRAPRAFRRRRVGGRNCVRRSGADGRACSTACWSAAPPSGPDRVRSTCRCR